MNRCIFLALVLSCSFAAEPLFAQDSKAPEGDTEERTCIPAEEVEQSSPADSGPTQEGAGPDGKPEIPVCDESAPVNEAETPEPVSASQDATDEGDAEEVDPAQEFEVNPEDEISEDYPVPLPSDI